MRRHLIRKYCIGRNCPYLDYFKLLPRPKLDASDPEVDPDKCYCTGKAQEFSVDESGERIYELDWIRKRNFRKPKCCPYILEISLHERG